MVLVIITAVHAFHKDVKAILKESGIMAYSYFQVVGHKENHDQSNNDNWFAGGPLESDSMMYQIFTDSEKCSVLMQHAKAFNAKQETSNAIHILKLQVNEVV